MEKSGYDFSKPSLGDIIEAKFYGPNDKKKKIQRLGGGFVTPRIGLGYKPSHLVKISGWRKDKW